MALQPGEASAPADYTIVSGATIAKLISNVQAKLVVGWEPKGSSFYVSGVWYQTLYKEGLQ